MDADDWKTFGAWLRARRDELGLSRRQVATAADISYSALQDLENGGRTQRGQWLESSPSNRVLTAVASALSLSREEVMTRAGRPTQTIYPEGIGSDERTRGQGMKALSGVERLSDEDFEYLQGLVDRLLGEEQ